MAGIKRKWFTNCVSNWNKKILKRNHPSADGHILNAASGLQVFVLEFFLNNFFFSREFNMCGVFSVESTCSHLHSTRWKPWSCDCYWLSWYTVYTHQGRSGAPILQFCFVNTRKSSCGKPHEVYRPQRNLSGRGVPQFQPRDTPVLAGGWGTPVLARVTQGFASNASIQKKISRPYNFFSKCNLLYFIGMKLKF